MSILRLQRLSLGRARPFRAQGPAGALRRLLNDQGGFSLVEIIVSIAVLATTSVALVGAMSTGYLGYRVAERDMTVLRLAMDQLEYVKCCEDYVVPPHNYPTFPDAPAEYVITTVAEAIPMAMLPADSIPRDPTMLQLITVTVSFQGRDMITISDYKRFICPEDDVC
jgi:prepilin-type N-terminal cleavage/methylation domain-containing protein